MDDVKIAGLFNLHSKHHNDSLFNQAVYSINRLNNGVGNGHSLCRVTYDEYSLNRDTQEIAEFRPEKLILSGGDASVLFYLSKLKEFYGSDPLPQLIFLATGTENRLSYELNYSEKPDTFLEQVVEDIEQGTESYDKMSLMEITLDGNRTYYNFEIGFGLAVNILANYYGTSPSQIRKNDDFRNLRFQKSKFDGFRTFAEMMFYSAVYVQSKLSENLNGNRRIKPENDSRLAKLLDKKNYWKERAEESFGSTNATITIDGQTPVDGSWLGGVAGTNIKLYRNFKPLHRGREDPEKMHLFVTSLPPAILALNVMNIYQGKPIATGADILQEVIGLELTSKLLGTTIEDTAKKIELDFKKEWVFQMAGEFRITNKVNAEVTDQVCFIKPNSERKKKSLF